MKTRIVWCCVLGLGWGVCTFLPVWSPERATILTLPPVLFVSFPMLVGLPIFTIYTFVGIFTQWKNHKTRALIPFALCIGLFFLASVARDYGFSMRMNTFRTNVPKFDEKVMSVVAELHRKIESGKTLEQPYCFASAGTGQTPEIG